MQEIRKQRIAELIKVDLSTIIQRDLAGRLPGMATIMEVVLSNDLRYAKIKVSFYGSEEAKRKSYFLLVKELKYLRRQLGKALPIRQVPFLTIVEDTSLDNAFRIEALLAQIRVEGTKKSIDEHSE